MKGFEFKLEKVLNLREFKEDKAKIELGKAVSEAEYLKSLLEKIAEEKVATRREMGLANFEIRDFIASERYLKMLDEKTEICLERLAEAELRVEEARKVFAEALRQRKILTKLKEKQQQAWKKAAAKEESEHIDDIVNSR